MMMNLALLFVLYEDDDDVVVDFELIMANL